MKKVPFLISLAFLLTIQTVSSQITTEEILGIWELNDMEADDKKNKLQKIHISEDNVLFYMEDDELLFAPLTWELTSRADGIWVSFPDYMRSSSFALGIGIKDENTLYIALPTAYPGLEPKYFEYTKMAKNHAIKIDGPNEENFKGSWNVTWTDGDTHITSLQLLDDNQLVVSKTSSTPNGAWFLEPGINQQSFLVLFSEYSSSEEIYWAKKLNKNNYLLSNSTLENSMVITRKGAKAKRPKKK